MNYYNAPEATYQSWEPTFFSKSNVKTESKTMNSDL